MPSRLWLTPRELAEEYGITYREALALAKGGMLRGYWHGSRYRFNALEVRRAYESGELERVLSEIA